MDDDEDALTNELSEMTKKKSVKKEFKKASPQEMEKWKVKGAEDCSLIRSDVYFPFTVKPDYEDDSEEALRAMMLGKN